MQRLLQLQDLDLEVDRYKRLEKEIPLQKRRFEQHRKQLDEELADSEKRWKQLLLDQRDCEKEIDQKQGDIRKKDGQLLSVKKNEEYQALLHEMEMLKKQIGLKEERILSLMEQSEEAKAHFEEDKKRISQEVASIEEECKKIDAELREAQARRHQLEEQIPLLTRQIDVQLLSRYKRIRKAKRAGAAVVPLAGETCSGCHMKVTAQTINEILAGEEFRPCQHCGRLLYWPDALERQSAEAQEGA